MQKFPEYNAKLCDGEKLTGTTGRKNEDLKGPEESMGSREGRLSPGGALEEPAGLSDQAHWRTQAKAPPGWGEPPPLVPVFTDPWG